jgi:hypothetical protein
MDLSKVAVEVLEGRVVRGDEAGPGAALDAHVADGHPLFHRQGPDGLAAVLEDVAGAAGDADPGDEGQDDVLGTHAGREPPIDPDLVRLRLALEERLGREDHLDFGRPDPECQRPECPVRARVGVATDDRHARLGQAQLRPDDVDDALARVADAVERNAELAAVRVELLDLGGRQRIQEGQATRGRWDGMVSGRDRPLRVANLQAALAKAGESLGAGHLVDEMEVDGEHARRAVILGDDVIVPDLLNEGAGLAVHGSDRLARVRAGLELRAGLQAATVRPPYLDHRPIGSMAPATAPSGSARPGRHQGDRASRREWTVLVRTDERVGRPDRGIGPVWLRDERRPRRLREPCVPRTVWIAAVSPLS